MSIEFTSYRVESVESGIGMNHKWAFRSRFKRHGFGWSPEPAIKRVQEAIAEIKAVARKDPVLAAEGAIFFLERVSPAVEGVESSSGAIGIVVNRAIDSLVPTIAVAPVGDELRDEWLKRLWRAVEEDEIPYVDRLADHWGELCVTPENASRWAEDFIQRVRMAWSQTNKSNRYFKGTALCMSALLKAGRNKEILELLTLSPHTYWRDRKWGVKALVAMGKKAEAIRFAENSRGQNECSVDIAKACEEILLASGMHEEAYTRYAIEANQQMTYRATVRAIGEKYPDKEPAEILNDLIASTLGDEDDWFATARSAGLYDEAIELANRIPCDPRALTRAARDMESTEPRFAIMAGIAALRWLVAGYGYKITDLDVKEALEHTMRAARNTECEQQILKTVRELVEREGYGERFVSKILGRELGLNRKEGKSRG